MLKISSHNATSLHGGDIYLDKLMSKLMGVVPAVVLRHHVVNTCHDTSCGVAILLYCVQTNERRLR